jgi:hypothetical protein
LFLPPVTYFHPQLLISTPSHVFPPPTTHFNPPEIIRQFLGFFSFLFFFLSYPGVFLCSINFNQIFEINITKYYLTGTLPSDTTTFDIHCQPICDVPASQMAPRTWTTSAASCNAHPSPPKTRKRTNSSAETKKSHKKSKPSITVEQDLKGGRERKRGKAQGEKKGKNRCAMHRFYIY